MDSYDPFEAPTPAVWLNLDESERNSLVLDYHLKEASEFPGLHAHAVIHAIVETQVAMGDETPVARTLDRLQQEGLDRHDAIHAVGSVLAGRIYDLLGGKGSSANVNQEYWDALERLTADGWTHAR